MSMKLGLGLYRHMLTKENFRFAKQAGCSHLVAHLMDYSGAAKTNNDCNESIWSYEGLMDLKKSIEEEGLKLYALENFNPADWCDILLDGPKKHEQMEHLKNIIRNVGKAGIPTIGYDFSIAGVWGHVKEPVARGGAMSVSFKGAEGPEETLIPLGQVWNVTYQPDAPKGTIGMVTTEELWQRVEYFLKEIIPVAEEAGVRMAAHPDDPPMPTLRGTARLVYQPQLYQKLLDLVPSHANAIEFCMGSIQEMTEGNIYDAIEQYCSQNKITYIHFRNVIGKVPHYNEVFVDEGDIDMIKALRLLKKHSFNGVLIPDHTPEMSCDAPWHAGMAYALGYMKAAISMVEVE